MFTRRRILQFSTALAAVKLSPAQTIPNAIAQLKSWRAEAHPISNEERQTRIERAQRLMQENKLNAIAMIGGTSLEYFSSVR